LSLYLSMLIMPDKNRNALDLCANIGGKNEEF